MKHFIKFEDTSSANGFYIPTPFLGTIDLGNDEYQNLHCKSPGKKIKVINNVAYIVNIEPLYFKSNGSTTISLSNNRGNAPDMKYSLDGGETWTQWNYSAISLNNGQKIYFKGNNPNGFSSSSSIYSKFVFGGSGTIKAGGNIMSLLDNGGCALTSIPNNYCFYRLFYNCTSLTSAPELPATALTGSCYYGMFQNCSSLTSAPKLPATTLAGYCYWGMFNGCTSLTSAPELPATTLTSSCYSYMFYGCSSLTSAPELPATTLSNNCYESMFSGCTSLTSAPELPATTLAQSCYSEMFSSCFSLTSAPELPATTLAGYCYYSMFGNCTSLTSAPELPATTLADRCYSYMFFYCSSLSYIKCLAITGIDQNNSTTSWVSGVASSGTFIKAPSASWPNGANGIPSGWTIQNA